jgi:hypothetical protein
LSEEEEPVIGSGQRLAGGQRTRSGSGLAQSHQREQADDASNDGGALQGPGADEAQRGRLVLPLDDRVQHHGGADAGEGHDYLQDGADDHRRVWAGANDVVRIAQHRPVEDEGRDRDEGDYVEQARDQRGLPQ